MRDVVDGYLVEEVGEEEEVDEHAKVRRDLADVKRDVAELKDMMKALLVRDEAR